MKTRVKISLTLALLLIVVILIKSAFILMNIASWAAFLLGIAVLIFGFIFLPPLFRRIWRKKSNDTQQNPTA